MKRLLISVCFILGFFSLMADGPTVPSNIRFAGMTLKLNSKAKAKIQAEVNALTKNPKYFQIKVDRLQMYFPIIERIFDEEGLPQDFKYLVLQESALISDAVSSSNAVGYWQFKKAAASEVGLRVDRQVDERKNIVSSTRGAARYILKNNKLYFDNWVHALLAYQQGPGGALKLVNKRYRGANSMPITGGTHWYVIKFLAHKVAFESISPAPPKYYLAEYYEGRNKSIKEIAQYNNLPSELVLEYNKWLGRGKVPSDKDYAVILPFTEANDQLIASGNPEKIYSSTVSGNRSSPRSSTKRRYNTKQDQYPQVYGASGRENISKQARINGISGMVVGGNDNLKDISERTGVSMKRLLYYNDLNSARSLKAGEILYLKRKKSKAKEHYHVVEPGESIWSISQKYGLKLSKLRDKNRLRKGQKVRPGRVLWLRFIRPADEPVAYQNPPAADEKPSVEQKAPVYQPEVIKSHSSALSDTLKNNRTKAKPNSAPEFQKTSPRKPQKTKDLKEVEEFELEEPVNFVGVDNGSNVTKTLKKVHRIQKGETLYGIARKYQTTVEDLLKLNNLDSGTSLSIGQEIIIRKSEVPQNEPLKGAENEFIYYEVKQGETLYQIARDHDATIKELMEWNEKEDFDISVGERIKLKKRP